VYSGSSLLADLNFQSVSGVYKNFTRMSPSEFEFLIHLVGEKISKKDTAFRKTISVQERLALTQVVIRALACSTFSKFPSKQSAASRNV
jgi:NAD dependent epimerase/dehydratase family enzyme